MKTHNFYQFHLDRVSRSFAFCIKRLDAPLRHWISVGYLVCRVLDTIEDSRWSSSADQAKAFKAFDRYLLSPEAEFDGIDDWHTEFPKSVVPAELELIQMARRIFEDIHSFPANLKASLQECVGSMSRGMQHFVFLHQESGQLKISSETEANQYCFFVAGVVGELLTKMLEMQDSRVKSSEELYCRSYHFGLFLQKINLLKDQEGDEKLGRYLVPNREAMRLSLAEHADQAFNYISAIPLEQKPYRLFCSWSLFLGLASIPYIEKSFGSGQMTKIPRARTLLLIKKIEYKISDPAAMRSIFEIYMTAARLTSGQNQAGKVDQQLAKWFKTAYTGRLNPRVFKGLGVMDLSV